MCRHARERRRRRRRRRRLDRPTAHGPGSTGRGLYLLVEDVGALFTAAVDAGATGVLAAETTEWGSERARVLDPEGHEWSFGTHEPGGSW
jgi:uncharacterized glyoxalase superfamily protein PhnB